MRLVLFDSKCAKSIINYNYRHHFQEGSILEINSRNYSFFDQKIYKNNMRLKEPQSESQEQSEEYRLQKLKKSNRKYSRITPQVKDKLIFLIVRSNMSIKQAANSVKINYSSAKFIFNQYRQKNQKCENFVTSGCAVVIKPIQKNIENGDDEDYVELRCTVGGKFQSQGGKVYSAEQVYNMNANGRQSGKTEENQEQS